jgi:hypothetical protein
VLSRHYLASPNCGKELAFFQRRWDEFVRTAEAPNIFAHRVLPLYWEDSGRCSNGISTEIMEFFKRLQHTQEEMPGNYPIKGLSQLVPRCLVWKIASNACLERLG